MRLLELRRYPVVVSNDKRLVIEELLQVPQSIRSRGCKAEKGAACGSGIYMLARGTGW